MFLKLSRDFLALIHRNIWVIHRFEGLIHRKILAGRE
jgi:hypothetical protein